MFRVRNLTALPVTIKHQIGPREYETYVVKPYGTLRVPLCMSIPYLVDQGQIETPDGVVRRVSGGISYRAYRKLPVLRDLDSGWQS